MVVLAVPRFAQLLVAACTVVACSSAPNLKRTLTVNPGERTVVHWIQVTGSQSLSLQNDSAQSAESVYTPSSGAIDPGRKIAADCNLQALLDVFSEKNLFEASLAEVPSDAREVIVVEQNKRRWIWALRKLNVTQVEQGFREARAEFLTLYNSSVAYNGNNSGAGDRRPDFGAENKRARIEAEKARLNLEGHRRDQR